MRTVAIVLVLLTSCRMQEGAAPSEEPRAVVAAPKARDPLAQRMREHAGEMSALRVARLTSDYLRIASAAREIAANPLVSPNTDPAAALPRAFFMYQDQMITDAGRIAVAADARDDRALDDAADALLATCRSCHTLVRSLQQ